MVVSISWNRLLCARCCDGLNGLYRKNGLRLWSFRTLPISKCQFYAASHSTSLATCSQSGFHSLKCALGVFNYCTLCMESLNAQYSDQYTEHWTSHSERLYPKWTSTSCDIREDSVFGFCFSPESPPYSSNGLFAFDAIVRIAFHSIFHLSRTRARTRPKGKIRKLHDRATASN